MLRDVLDGSSGGGRRAMRLLAAMAALFCAVVLSAMFMPTRAEARYLNVKFVIDNIDEHPDKKDVEFYYICSFYKWNDYKTGGWRISKTSKQWTWEDLDDSWVAGPNDHDSKYWNYIDAKHGQTVRANAHDGDCFYFYPQIGHTHKKTAAGLSLVRIEWAGNTYQIGYDDQGHGQYIVPFNYGGFVGVGDGSVVLHMRYDEGIPKSKPIVPDLTMTTSKQIDYLGDGQPNPDTPNHYGANDYRLYLTGNTKDNTAYATYKPKNIIFAIDISKSMNYTFDGNENGGSERFRSLKSAANKLMDGLSKSDTRNRFSVVYFSSYDDYGKFGKGGGSGVKLNKGSASQARDEIGKLKYANAGGTDYYSAFREIGRCCSDTPSDMENVVIFLTDGEPSSVPKDVLPRKMGALSQSIVAVPYTQDAAKKGGLKYQVSQFYSVFIGTNTGSSAVMSMIVQSLDISEKAAVQASSNSDMQKLIDKLTNRLKKPEVGVAMSDTLSKYVDPYTQPEYFKVTAKTTGSSEEPRVLNPGSDYEVNYDGASRTIRMKIKGRVTKDTTYTFSYDVKVNSTALKEWKLSGYPHVGDENTDYTLTGNTTSSGKPGFFSSEIDKAVGQITYDLGSGDQSADFEFPKPVVQVADTNNSNGKIMGHVTLYNMELRADKFTFELVDSSNNKPLAPTTNDAKGDFSFDVNSIALTPGVYTYKLRQSTPPDINSSDKIGGDHIKYDTHEVDVKVTVTDDPTSGLQKQVEYAKDSDKKAHFYNSFGIQGTYQ